MCIKCMGSYHDVTVKIQDSRFQTAHRKHAADQRPGKAQTPSQKCTRARTNKKHAQMFLAPCRPPHLRKRQPPPPTPPKRGSKSLSLRAERERLRVCNCHGPCQLAVLLLAPRRPPPAPVATCMRLPCQPAALLSASPPPLRAAALPRRDIETHTGGGGAAWRPPAAATTREPLVGSFPPQPGLPLPRSFDAELAFSAKEQAAELYHELYKAGRLLCVVIHRRYI